VRRFLAMRVAYGEPIRLKQALSLRMHADANYYHVLNDILGGKLRLAEEGGVSADVPIVISSALAAAPFFREIQALPSMQGRRWVVQGARQFVRTDDVFFAEASRQGTKANFDHARLLLGVQDGDPSGRDRLFRDAGTVVAPRNLQPRSDRAGMPTVRVSRGGHGDHESRSADGAVLEGGVRRGHPWRRPCEHHLQEERSVACAGNI